MFFFKLLIITFLCSCAKLSYLVTQGYGQLDIEIRGRDNRKVLKDKSVSDQHKDKIKKIIQYKKYFYSYFQEKETSIYSETTFLDRPAVSYLVIASKFNEVKPLETSFPLVGAFPYLGFYSKEDALTYQKELEQKKYYTFLRPVHAYSTLNKLFFKDNILSSFFIYDDIDLAELIFHELIHTIFFIEDNMSFNESLADYISQKMTIEYLEISKEKTKRIIDERKYHKLLEKEVYLQVNKYKKVLENEKITSKDQADVILENFLKNDFYPHFKSFCNDKKDCWPLKRKWNNASFTAFVTYNDKKDIIEKLAKNYNLKDFINYLQKMKEEFKRTDEKSFTKFLEERESK